jgi:hypothetical protein
LPECGPMGSSPCYPQSLSFAVSGVVVFEGEGLVESGERRLDNCRRASGASLFDKQ